MLSMLIAALNSRTWQGKVNNSVLIKCFFPQFNNLKNFFINKQKDKILIAVSCLFTNCKLVS
jgi:hypothetical protein